MKIIKNMTIDDFSNSLRIIDSMLIETGGNEKIMFEIIASSISKAKSYEGNKDEIVKVIDKVYSEFSAPENSYWRYADKMLYILSEIKKGIVDNKIFNFQLKKVRDCQMEHACWFYLTDSYYYLQLGKERIYEYEAHTIKKDKLKSPMLDYYFSRFLEDIFVVLIETIQPIPKEIYRYFDTDKKYDKLANGLNDWYYGIKNSLEYFIDVFDRRIMHEPLPEPPKEKEQIFHLLGMDFLWRGSLDSSFISGSVLCRFVHVEDMMYIHYDCTKHKNVWTAGKDIFEIPYKDFIAQVEAMIEDFFHDMDKQVANAIETLSEYEYSWNNYSEGYKKKFPEQFLEPRKTGAEQLQEEHRQRKAFFYDTLNKVKSGKPDIMLDWNEVKEKMVLVFGESLMK